MKKLSLSLAALSSMTALAHPAAASTVYMGSYPDKLLVMDEASGNVLQRITLASGLPTSLQISNDKKKIYITTITTSGIEVMDVASKKIVNSFSLNTPTTRYRFNGGVPDPSGRYFYTVMQKFEKLNDRYLVSPGMFAMIDLKKQEVVKTIEIPKEEDTNPNIGWRAKYMMSPDGKNLYIFRDKIMVLDPATLKIKETIDLEKPQGTGMESVSFGGTIESLRSTSEYVSIYNAEEPNIKSKVYGIGRFNLVTKVMDFTPVGPSPEGMSGLQVSPDLKEGWTVVTNGKTGNKRCEFWHLDLTTNMVKDTAEFPCRSRFQFGTSGDSKKLYIYGASYDLEVYDAQSLKHEKTLDLGNDMTMAGMLITP